MFLLDQAALRRMSIHFMNHEDNQLELTKEEYPIPPNSIGDMLDEYMKKAFLKTSEYYSLTHSSGDASLNALGTMASELFSGDGSFHETTERIARHLFQVSDHHGIKSGDLFVAQLQDIAFEDELIDAIVILKSEQKQSFLKADYMEGSYELHSDIGINISKIDKACIIYNTNQSDGYVVAFKDTSSPAIGARYWVDDFMKVKPLDDAFAQTQLYMNMAQTYVAHQLSEDVEITKGDQLSILNQAGEFFKKNQSYNETQFVNEVLEGQPEVVESFQNYKRAYAQEMEVEMPDQFAISNLAAKKYAKDFKSVLKLDKNFHVYIHGDRKMIEHGRDEDGRKFYKLYYEEEA